MRELSKTSFGTTPVSFERALVNALREEEKPMKRKSIAFVMVMTLLVLALACTALAVGLSQSARYTALRDARAALMEKYGITSDTLGVFIENKAEGQGTTTIVYSPIKFDHDRIGEYIVVLRDGEAPKVTWTYDGTDLEALAEMGLESEIWGAKQLEEALRVDRTYYERLAQTDWTDEDIQAMSSLERAAMLDQEYVDAGIELSVYNLMPGEDDIPLEKAFEMADQILVDAYDADPDDLALFEVHASFLKYANHETPVYRVYYSRERADADPEHKWEGYGVEMASPSGEVNFTYWGIDPMLRTLPDGPLDKYESAIKEFVEEGAYEVRTAAERADLSQRIIAAGYGEYIDDIAYEMPGDGDLAETEAIAAAETILREQFGFDDEGLTLLTPHAGIRLIDGKRVWEIRYVPDIVMNWIWLLTDRMGEYHVLLAAEDGALVEATWTLQKAYDAEKDAEAPRKWGAVEAIDATLLPEVIRFITVQNALIASYDEADEWSLEDQAIWDGRYRDAGFPQDMYSSSLPEKGELSQADAERIAREALMEEFGLDADTLDESFIRPHFSIAKPEKPVWGFTFFLMGGRQDSYYVEIDARTQEVMYTEFVATGNG